MPRAGRWLEEAGGSHSDGSNNVQDLSTMGHMVVGQVTLSHRASQAIAEAINNALTVNQHGSLCLMATTTLLSYFYCGTVLCKGMHLFV